MKSKTLIIAFLLIFVYGCSKNETNDENATTDQTSVMSDDYTRSFSLALNNGDKLSMQKTQNGFSVEDNNKAMLFSFFTTWCPPCKAEIPHLVSLQNKFSDKLRVVGVLMEERSTQDMDEFIKMFNINYNIAYGEENFFFAKALGGVVGIPYMVLYYPDGKYATHYVGIVPEEMLESDIKKVLL
ncbi:protein disulfide reductase, TlpA family [Campylobacter iguaniorum]|uniref:Protein disulfide reductase, TlpA family n=1 Tax=Campylobacter iguaniorum TaxID=1244531 RepID=A0A076F897_9BACT|nr:TlpA disulfide reductase family protein [Campylobacter iguaniorum]AII14440.1 protein disulfide reductase, TlpA family [Campylobacter iguaniorum]ALV24174.1 protein disulfide reductase, TlpA family [Campylobacter iguaniorum]ANE35589.1 protein disulfide reductase, TlpA family [Campylobacter iguaniorum]